MLRLKPSNVTPPDGFSYRVPQDGTFIRANTREVWLARIRQHYTDNGYEIPANLEEIVEDALCRRLSGEWCVGGTPHSFITTRFTIDDFLRGTKVVGSFALSDATVVAPEEAERRALICSRCPLNVPVPGCTSCLKMADVVATAKGARGTKYDHLLQACGICHCSNEAQVWYPAESLRASVTPEMIPKYAEIDQVNECWKYQAVIAAQSEEQSP